MQWAYLFLVVCSTKFNKRKLNFVIANFAHFQSVLQMMQKQKPTEILNVNWVKKLVVLGGLTNNWLLKQGLQSQCENRSSIRDIIGCKVNVKTEV